MYGGELNNVKDIISQTYFGGSMIFDIEKEIKYGRIQRKMFC